MPSPAIELSWTSARESPATDECVLPAVCGVFARPNFCIRVCRLISPETSNTAVAKVLVSRCREDATPLLPSRPSAKTRPLWGLDRHLFVSSPPILFINCCAMSRLLMSDVFACKRILPEATLYSSPRTTLPALLCSASGLSDAAVAPRVCDRRAAAFANRQAVCF